MKSYIFGILLSATSFLSAGSISVNTNGIPGQLGTHQIDSEKTFGELITELQSKIEEKTGSRLIGIYNQEQPDGSFVTLLSDTLTDKKICDIVPEGSTDIAITLVYNAIKNITINWVSLEFSAPIPFGVFPSHITCRELKNRLTQATKEYLLYQSDYSFVAGNKTLTDKGLLKDFVKESDNGYNDEETYVLNMFVITSSPEHSETLRQINELRQAVLNLHSSRSILSKIISEFSITYK